MSHKKEEGKKTCNTNIIRIQLLTYWVDHNVWEIKKKQVFYELLNKYEDNKNYFNSWVLLSLPNTNWIGILASNRTSQ